MSEYGLLFCLVTPCSESEVGALRDFIAELGSQGKWANQPPLFVDEIQGAEPKSVRNVGGFLHLPPPSADREVERACFEDVERLVNALSAFSARTGSEFELELGGVYAGDIANGQPNEFVRRGLLDEWRKALQHYLSRWIERREIRELDSRWPDTEWYTSLEEWARERMMPDHAGFTAG